jgi:hypothetical protein
VGLQSLLGFQTKFQSLVEQKQKGDEMKLTDRETAQILAALRFWQEKANLNDVERYIEFFNEHGPLDDLDIDALCENLNFGGKS